MSEPELRIGAGVPAAAVTPAAVGSQQPKSHTRAALVALTVVVVLAGLGAAAFVVLRSESAPSAAASPSPTVKTASVAQYAGTVNGPIIKIKESWAKYEEEHCAVRENISGNLTCALGLMGLDMQMQTLVYTIDGAAKLGAPAFIGAPPAEVAALVAETRAQAQLITDMIPEDGEEDMSLRLAVSMAMSKMETIFAKWAPYV